MINTGAMVDQVIATLSGALILVGDGVAPEAGGWTQGSPNVDEFVAYSVVAFEGAVPAMPDLSADQDWDLTLAIGHYGGRRKQCDFQANLVRQTAPQVRSLTVEGFKIINARFTSLGGVIRNDQVSPPYWGATDLLVLTCSA